MNNKRVAILMCTKNRAYIMLYAIKCILEQTYKDFDFIIINDNSSDNTELILKNLQKQDNRIIYYNTTPNNCGLINARNLSFNYGMNYEYIAIIDSDDKCSPNKIMEQVKYLDNHKDIDVVGCKIKFGERAHSLTIPKTHIEYDNNYFNNELENNNENISMLIHFPSCMFRTSSLKTLKFNNDEFFKHELENGGEDQCFLYYLWLNGLQFANINTSIYLYNYLEYNDSISGNVGEHFNTNNYIFKYIHNKPLKDKITKISELYE